MKCLTFIALAAVAAIASASAFATSGHNQPPPKQDHTCQGGHNCNQTSTPSSPSSASTALAGSSSKSDANSKSDASSYSGSMSNASGGKSSSTSNATGGKSTSDQHQTAAATGGHGGAATVDDSGNASVTVEGDTYEAARIPVATAIAGGTNTTAACRYSVGGGGQAPVVGLSLGWGRKDVDCERFALAQFMYDRGNDAAGDLLLCKIRSVRDALGSDCLTLVHQTLAVREDSRLIKKREFERINK